MVQDRDGDRGGPGVRSVLVGMSGGVDSSVAVLLLKRSGLRVCGVTLRLFGCEVAAGGGRSCCSRQDVMDAMRVAGALGVEHEVWDLSDEFGRRVLGPFVAGYARGETPNPCVACNRYIKFGAMLGLARVRGFDAVATGHYARVERGEGRWRLLRGRDAGKDQSYFVHPMGQEQLGRVLFPVGGLTKREVRALAAGAGLPVAQKRESQEICFAAGGSYVAFLESRGVEARAGEIVLRDGTVVGRHAGLHRHTVGQRKGVRVALGRPVYVVEKRVEENRLVVGPREETLVTKVRCMDAVWTCGRVPAAGEELSVQVRYRSKAGACRVTGAWERGFGVELAEPAEGVARGQAAVLYAGEEVVGGGTIEEAGR